MLTESKSNGLIDQNLTVESLFSKADKLRIIGKWEEARLFYKRVVELEPDHWWAYHYLGDTLLNLEEYETAIESYQKCLELKPDLAVAYHNMGVALLKLGKPEEAFDSHNKVTEINPDFWASNSLDFEIQHQLGDFWFTQKEWEKASIAYNRAILLNPQFNWSHSNLGRALHNLGRVEEAIASIRKAVEIDPNFSLAYYYLGEMLSELGDLDQAIHSYKKAIEKDPENPDFHYRLGMTLVSQGQWEEATACYHKVSDLQPEHWQNQNILKEALTSNQKLFEQPEEEVYHNYQNSELPQNEVKTEPSVQVLSRWQEDFDQGNQLQIQGKLEEATRSYYKAIIRNPLHSWSYHNLGDTYLKLGHWQEAIDAYHQAIKLNPDYFWSNYNLGVAFSNAGQWGEAVNLYRRSVDLNPGLNLPFFALREALTKRWNAMMSEGDILLRQGDREAANSIYKTAIRQYTESLYLPEINQPKEIPTTPSVLLVVDNFLTQCLRYRVQQKVEQIEAAGFFVEYIPQQDVMKAKNLMHFYHVVIFYRVPAFPEVIETIQYAKAIKKLVFYEIDDLVFDPKEYPDTFESYGNQITREEYEGLVRGVILFREAMALVEDGIASTPALAEEMEKVVSRKVFLHRNALDHHNSDFLKLGIPKLKRDYLTIFYGTGTKAHNSDFNELVAPAIAKILEKYPDVRFTLIGYLTLPEILEPYKSQIDQVGILKDLNVYWEFLRQADINIAVLHNTKANNCKSELKWFEAGVLGVPSVVSGTQTYQEVVEDGVDGLIANTPEEWYQQLERLVTDETLRHSIAQAAAEKAKQQYSIPVMADNIKKIITAGMAKAMERGDLVPRSAKKKLLIVNVFYPPQSIGGATRIVRDNVDILKEKYSHQYEISVFTSDDDNSTPYQISEYVYKGVHVTKVSTPMMVGMDWQYQNPELYDIFSQYLKFNQPDIIHFHCIQRLTASVLEAAADLKIPYLVTIHDAWWISDHQFLVNQEGVECDSQQNDPLVVIRDVEDVTASIQRRQYLRQRLEQASAVLAVSETFAELYRRNGILKTQSNRNGIMPRPKFPRQPSASGKVRLAHIGGMAAHKGYFLFKEAIESNSFSNLEVIVVNHAQSAGTTSQDQWGNTPVTYIAKISQEKMPQFYSTIDILVAPSMWPESYGLVTREATAAGVWVIASNKGALAEDLIQGVNGDVLNPDKMEEFVDILRRIDGEPEKYRQLVTAEIHVRTTEEQVRELNDIYSNIF